MGGVVAQHVAFSAPDRLTALILMDTSPDPVVVDAELVELACGVVTDEGIPALLALQQALGGPLDTDAGRRLRAERPGWNELQDQKLLNCSAEMYVTMARLLTSMPSRAADLATLAVPTLVLVGEHDRLLREPALRLAEAIPDARLVVIPGAGHSPQVEAPAVWFEAVTAFLG
jgi:pimeloyl-ACP methyl ester carboxylesterase